MKTTNLLLILSCLVLAGCTLIPTDMFPRATWFWSADAKAYRERQAQYQRWEATNSVPKGLK